MKAPTKNQEFCIIFLFFVVTFLSYRSEYKPEKCEVRIRQDKAICFCNGLSVQSEKQCPTMNDL
jgi:hypothetical protein